MSKCQMTYIYNYFWLLSLPDVTSNGIDQPSGRGQTRTLALVDLRDDRYPPGGQRLERCLRRGVGEKRRVERRADDHRRRPSDSLGNDGQRKVVGNTVGELVERVEAAGREQHHPARWPRADRQIEIGFDDLCPLDVRHLARRDDARRVR